MQGLKPPPSSWHWKLATPVPPPSLPVKLKLAVALPAGLAGLAVMVVSGAAVSITQVKLAGVPSALPAASTARTWKVCEPSLSPV